jgi:hypothetical protein
MNVKLLRLRGLVECFGLKKLAPLWVFLFGLQDAVSWEYVKTFETLAFSSGFPTNPVWGRDVNMPS